MKKALGILFCTVFCCFAAFADEVVNCTENGGKKFCTDAEGKPVTGKIVLRYDNGNTKSLENLKDGYRNGLVSEYSEDGFLDNRTYYKMGVKNGMSKIYHKNRNIKIRASYNDGLLDGVSEIYNDKEELVGKVQYKKGQLKGGYCAHGPKLKKAKFSFFEIQNSGFNHLIMCGQQ